MTFVGELLLVIFDISEFTLEPPGKQRQRPEREDREVKYQPQTGTKQICHHYQRQTQDGIIIRDKHKMAPLPETEKTGRRDQKQN